MESSKKIPKKQVVPPTKADIGLGNVDNTSDATKPISNAVQSALDGKQSISEKNQPDGYAGLDANGKIESSRLPAIAVTDTFVVASESAMLALTAETGDVAVRTDLSKSFILKGISPTVLSNWTELLTPTSPVTSVHGRTGAVTANTGDYTTAQVTETTDKKYQTDNQKTFNDATSSIQNQLDSKENTSNKSTNVVNDGASDIKFPSVKAVKTYVDAQVASTTIVDASTTVKGKIKLAGDIGGTADLPTVPALADKVDKITGKGLSTEDYTTTEKNKLAGIQPGAEVNVNADWNATSGDAQILNKPTIPAAQIQSDWNQSSNTSADFIKNKPIIPSVTGLATQSYVDAKLEDAIVDGVTGKAPSQNAVFDALANKVDKVTGKGLSTNDYTNAEKDKLANLATVATSGSYDDLDDKPIIPSFDPLELDDVEKTFWNRGKGGISSNLSFGKGALASNINGDKNTALGNGALGANESGSNNIALGYNSGNELPANARGLTLIGVDSSYAPDGNYLGHNCLSISQYNPDFAENQVPHFYAPDKIECANNGVKTPILLISPALYTAVFIEYSVFNEGGDKFRAGTFTVAFKPSGSTVDNDNKTVIYSGTTSNILLSADSNASGVLIRLENNETENFFIRYTARLLMR